MTDIERKKLEIEILKLKVEKLKFWESLLRTIFIVIVPVGAGNITLIYWIYGKTEFINKILLVVSLISFSLFFILIWIIFHKIYRKEREINRILKELEK